MTIKIIKDKALIVPERNNGSEFVALIDSARELLGSLDEQVELYMSGQREGLFLCKVEHGPKMYSFSALEKGKGKAKHYVVLATPLTDDASKYLKQLL